VKQADRMQQIPLDIGRIRAIVFDYGNTLGEFGRDRVRAYDRALVGVLARLYGSPDMAALHAIRDRDRRSPYTGDPPAYRENDLRAITAGLVRQLYGVEPSHEDVAAILQVRFDAFLDIIQAGDGVAALLGRLKKRYRLGLLSNYPDAAAVRASLAGNGLEEPFDTVVVSGDVGYVKPHPLLFEIVTRDLGVGYDEALMVGDNWLADIQGAKRAGMWAAHVVQWTPHEEFERKPGDLEPDLVLWKLGELEGHLA